MWLKNIIFTLLCLILCAENASAAKILCVFPSESQSHLIVGKALLKELANRGHQVTMVSSFPQKSPIKNYRDIYITEDKDHSEFVKNFLQEHGSMMRFPQMIKMTLRKSNQTLNDPQVQKIMSEESFDLVIVGYFMADFSLGLGSHFKCPVVILWSGATAKFVTNFVGSPSPPSTVPHLFLGHTNVMTFMDRVKNFLLYVGDAVFIEYINYIQEPFYTSNFPPDKYPSYLDARKNVSLVLVNQHFTQAVPRPYIQNIVEVGGLQVKQNPNPLPDDIKQWLDDAKDGFIFLSFGSNVKFSILPPEKVNIFVNALSKLNQRIIWTNDMDDLPNKPSNVMIKKWLPQDDILAHKNIKLFISHCGLGSLTEAKYHAVPILGMPIFADQFLNMQNIIKEGWGIHVDFKKLTEQALEDAIAEILNNPTYKSEVLKLSELFRDRPQSPMDLAVFWVEYVMRHRGAYHMRYQGVDLNILQSSSLDVIGFLIVATYIAIKLVILIVKMLIKCTCKNKKKEKIN